MNTLIYNTQAIDAVNDGQEVPYYIKQDGKNVARLKWHASSAWRGYYELEAVKSSGWELVPDASDWTTGDWDDAIAEVHGSTPTEARLEALAKANQAAGYETLVVFTPTSNVFSTSFDVLKRKLKSTNKPNKIANNTYKTETAGGYTIRLHNTDILTLENQVITLDSGGWRTVTTKDRLNKYLPSPWSIKQRKGKWYLVDELHEIEHEYRDGIKIRGHEVLSKA